MKKSLLVMLVLGTVYNVSAQNIYNSNGALTSDRTVTLGSYTLNFDSSTLFIDGSSSRVGIGTTSPSTKLEVSRAFGRSSLGTNNLDLASFVGTLNNLSLTDEQKLVVSARYYNGMGSGPSSRLQSYFNTTKKGFIEFGKSGISTTEPVALMFGFNETPAVQIYENGKVSIGNVTTPSGYKLFVEEGILTEKVKVALKTTTDWADYVFAPDYKLMPLEEVELFTKENKHLPNVPSAEEMVKNGLNVAEMDAKLLEKIEELTLYAIDQEKQADILNKELETVKAALTRQQNEIEELKTQLKILLEK
jgi:hypothetical protein